MIDFFQYLVHMFGDIEGMINGACSVEQDHTDDKDSNCDRSKAPGCVGRFSNQWNGGNDCKDHGDKVGQGTARIFDVYIHREPPT